MAASSQTGVRIPEGADRDQVLLQVAHHLLLASAKAVKLGHEIDPENKIGCMVCNPLFYPETCKPDDQIQAMKDNDAMFYFSDTQVRGGLFQQSEEAVGSTRRATQDGAGG